jgi:hypothetical protein
MSTVIDKLQETFYEFAGLKDSKTINMQEMTD